MSTAIIIPSSSNTPGLDNLLEQPAQQQAQQQSASHGKSSMHSRGSTSSTTCTTSTTSTTCKKSKRNPNKVDVDDGDGDDDEAVMEREMEKLYRDGDSRDVDNNEGAHPSNSTDKALSSSTNDEEPKLLPKPTNKHQDRIVNESETIKNVKNGNDKPSSSNSNESAMVMYNPDPLKLSTLSTVTTNTAKAMPATTTTAIHVEKSKHKGLCNLGNTCYLNSALQMLFSVDGFVSMILNEFDHKSNRIIDEEDENVKNEDVKDANDDRRKKKENELKESYPLHCALANLFQAMQPGDNETDVKEEDTSSPLSAPSTIGIVNTFGKDKKEIEMRIRELKKVIDTLTPQFNGYWQQDSHEFLSTLLDLLHDEYEAQHKKQMIEGIDGNANDKSDGGNNDGDAKEMKIDEKKENTDDMDEEMKVLTEIQEKADEEDKEETAMNMTLDEPAINSTHEHDVSSSSTPTCNVAMKEGKEGYILVNKLQTMLSSDETDAQCSKKPRFTGSMATITATTTENQIDQNKNLEHNNIDGNNNHVEDSQGDIEMNSCSDNSSSVLGTDSMSRVSSFSELKVEDIGLLLHGRQEHLSSNNSNSSLPMKNKNGNDKDQKLVGGRVSCVATATNYHLKMAIDEETNNPNDEINGGENGQQSHQESDSMQTPQQQEQEQQSDDTSSVSKIPPKPTPVDLFFTMEVKTCLTCNSCSFARSRIETFRHLSLEIGDCDDDGDTLKKSSSISSTISSLQQHHYERKIQEGLRNFFGREQLELKCEKCFGESATQSMEITRLPKVLVLHLKRFIVDVSPDYSRVTYRKNRSAVEFGERLTLDVDDSENGALGEFIAGDVRFPSISKQEKQKKNSEDTEGFELLNPMDEYESDEEDEFIDLGNIQKSFELRSVVNHIGSSANCGHYTANVSKLKNSTDGDDEETSVEACTREWWNFNDSYVSHLHDDNAINGEVQKSAYLLLYELNK